MIAQLLSESTNVKNSCDYLGIPRCTYYRKLTDKDLTCTAETKSQPSPLALTQSEKQAVIDLLHSPRFVDQTPYEIYATLLDEGKYYCSIRTMYRYLQEKNEANERRRGHKKHHYSKPELLATKPNETWSWDITRLKGPRKWHFYQLYVIMDIFSRYVVGWMVSEKETGILAKDFIESACHSQGISEDQLTLHSDRGSSMKSKTVAELLSDLCVTKSFSRPRVSNDNPFSESQFKTLKYYKDFPERFYSLEEARIFCRTFFNWYNNKHKHSGIALLSPSVVHHGQSTLVLEQRKKVLESAFFKTPERFKGKKPVPLKLDKVVYINKPSQDGLRNSPCNCTVSSSELRSSRSAEHSEVICLTAEAEDDLLN